MSEPQERKAGPATTESDAQDQSLKQGLNASDAARPRVPDTIGVYDRPTGLKRYPAWLIALMVLIMLASLAYFLFTFVF